MGVNWPVGLILVCVGLGVTGELLFKTGAMQLSGLDFSSISGAAQSIPSILSRPAILVAFIVYGVASVLWIVVLTRLDLSFAYPMYALMYAIIPIAAYLLLHEHIPAGRWVGIFFIVLGVFIIFHLGSA